MTDSVFIQDSDELTLTGAELKSFQCFFAKEVSKNEHQEALLEGGEAENSRLRFFISQSIVKMKNSSEIYFQSDLIIPACVT